MKPQVDREESAEPEAAQTARPVAPGGLAGWLLSRVRRTSRPRPHLALVERITLAPRQSLALVEADGRRLLVATSADSAPVIYPLESHLCDERPGASSRVASRAAAPAPASSASKTSRRRARGHWPSARPAPRVSW